MQRHDIILNDGTLDIGFMLAVDKNGPVYAEKEMSPFSFMQSAGYIDESSQNPQAMYPISFQKTGVGGYGQYFMGQSSRYLASYGVDASVDGVLKLGPKWTAMTGITVTAFTALVDGGLETWASSTDLTNWTETSITRAATPVHGAIAPGTYSAYFDATNDLISQTVYASPNLPTEFRGRVFEFSAWVYQAAANALRVRIYDGISTTYSTTATTGAWTKVTHRKVLDATSADQLVVSIISNGGATDNYADDCYLTGPTTSTTGNCYAEYNGLQYMSVGNILMKANSASAPTAWTYVTNFNSDITALYSGQVAGIAYLFVMIGSGNNLGDRGYYYDGSTFTQMTDAGGTDASGTYMAMASTTFYISGRPTGVLTGEEYVIRTNTAPLAGAWSSDTLVGDPNTSINSLLNCNGVIYIPKEDSLWYVKTDGTVAQIIDYSDKRSATSGKNAFTFNNKVYIPLGVSSIIEYDPSSGTWGEVSPSSTQSSITQAQIATASAVMSSEQTDFDGRIMALAGGGTGNYLWGAQSNGSVINLFKGIYGNIDSVGWHWHPVANTTMGDVNCMFLSALTGSPIIWVGAGTTTGYYDLAKFQTTDPTYTVPCIITSYFTGGVWRMMKSLYSIILGLEAITASCYVTLQYRFYGTTSWSTALTFDGASGTVSNGMDSNYMPANSYGTAIQFRLNFYSGWTTIANGTGITATTSITPGSTTITATQIGTFTVTLPAGFTGTATTGSWDVTGSPQALAAGANTVTTTGMGGSGTFVLAITGTPGTPKVTRLSGEGVIKPTEVSVIQCTVLLADHQVLRTGAQDTMPASRKLSGLNTCRSSNWPVTFKDITGATFTVDVMSREDATAPEIRAVGRPRFVKNLLMRKVQLT